MEFGESTHTFDVFQIHDVQKSNIRERRQAFWYQQNAAQKQAQSFLELILGVMDTLQFGKRKLGAPS